MKKRGEKILAFILVLAMTFTPLTVLAEDGNTETIEQMLPGMESLDSAENETESVQESMDEVPEEIIPHVETDEQQEPTVNEEPEIVYEEVEDDASQESVHSKKSEPKWEMDDEGWKLQKSKTEEEEITYYTKTDGIVILNENKYYFDEKGVLITGFAELFEVEGYADGKYYFKEIDKETDTPENSDMGKMQISTSFEKDEKSYEIDEQGLVTEKEIIKEEETENNTTFEAPTLIWPVPGHTNRSQGFHDNMAIDISDGHITGAPVVAALGGTVTQIFLCPQQHLGSNHNCNGFGTGLVIRGTDGRLYQYAHMQANSIPGNVYRGAAVSAGQTIGAVGTTGNSSGPHLHFGITASSSFWIGTGINPDRENYTYTGATVQMAWEGYTTSFVEETNAGITGRAVSNVSGNFTEAGATIWNASGAKVAEKKESASHTGTYLNVWYDIRNEMGASLSPGTTYQYQMYVIFNGTRYDSPRQSFKTGGSQAKNGWSYENGSTYYYKNNQKLTGWQTISGNQYYFSRSQSNPGNMAKGFTQIGNKYYYFSGSPERRGVMLTGLTKVGNDTYYFQSWGTERGARYSGWIIINGQRYYFNKYGKMVKGWNVISNNMYYFSRNSGHLYTGFCTIDGKKYYFSKAAGTIGVRKIGLTQIGNTYYYFEPHGITGARQVGNNKWYFNEGKFLFKL